MPLFNKKHPVLLNLAIWGPPQSGKTTLLATMNLFCETHGWALKEANIETLNHIEAITGRLSIEGKPVDPSAVLAPETYRFVLQRTNKRRFQELILEVPDAAGEFYANPEHALFNMIDYLNGCEGIMWLLDPVALKEGKLYGTGETMRNYRQMINRTLTRMFQTKYGSTGRIDKYMAFVFTKMDHPDHSQYFNDPTEYAQRLLDRETLMTISNHCLPDRVAYFSTSALGFSDPGHTVSNLDESNPDSPTLRTKDIRPIGVFDPLNWLLESLV